ncbi:hypothetical protein JD78_03260 [Modestobacter roseus]|uniref:Uncharacterized protein n=1 Tax=Modestobacter roseus TaxID=1181884 RepID=A0A562IVK8_9ACTN|nr:hypothetical protein JD78_03260 [Modestobacter roseus]
MRAAIGTVSLTGAAMGFMTACGTGYDDEEAEARTVYCVDEQDQVVDEDLCEEAERSGGYVGGFPYFFLLGGFGGNRYSVGQTIPQQYTGAANRVNPSDTSARTRAGLPGSGRVSSGSRISGGIGSGRVGSGSVGS